MERLNTFLTKHLWLQIVLSIRCASAVILLISPGNSARAVLLRVAVMSVVGVLMLVILRCKEKRAASGSTAVTSRPRQTTGFALFVGWLIVNGNLQNRRLQRTRQAGSVCRDS
ncbi:hypothetical protein AB0O67_12725 [Streptomyces sp. NPDC086077]|uniref:hypothetical protein n=1 Tax=Streptomyces sp. NPDC086077 TaxID=3154862 RepID=UPI003431E939